MYHVSCNIRLDGATGLYFRTIIAVDGVADISKGLHSIRGSPPSSYFTMVVDGNAYLRVGQRVSVYIVVPDPSTGYVIQVESGFSAYYIGRGGDHLHLGYRFFEGFVTTSLWKSARKFVGEGWKLQMFR